MSDQVDIKPIAFVTGYMRGYPTIKALDKALVFNVGMALYSYEEVLKFVQAEREECAKLAEEQLRNTSAMNSMPPMSQAAWAIWTTIKARGEVK